MPNIFDQKAIPLLTSISLSADKTNQSANCLCWCTIWSKRNVTRTIDQCWHLNCKTSRIWLSWNLTPKLMVSADDHELNFKFKSSVLTFYVVMLMHYSAMLIAWTLSKMKARDRLMKPRDTLVSYSINGTFVVNPNLHQHSKSFTLNRHCNSSNLPWNHTES